MIEGIRPPTAEDMREPMIAVFVWHAHHDILFEPMIASAIEERKQNIIKHKPSTAAVRLQLMKPVKMAIPADLQQAANLSWTRYRHLCSLHSAHPDVQEAARTHWREAEQAYKTLERRYLPEFYLAHRAECFGCSWDGHSIFPTWEVSMEPVR